MEQGYAPAYSPRIQRQFKKVRESGLVEKIASTRQRVLSNPYEGSNKTGDLQGLRTASFQYNGTSYRIAYYVDENSRTVLFVFFSTRENFYEELKNYLK